LCPEHAKIYSGADFVLTSASPTAVLKLIAGLGIRPTRPPKSSHPYPAFDLIFPVGGGAGDGATAVAIQTTVGCPFGCSYCASGFLNPFFRELPLEEVIQEMRFWKEEYGVTDLALYDDAFLLRRDIVRLLEAMASLAQPLRIHTPNALHASRLTPLVASLMRQAGFKTVRIGLETVRREGGKAYDKKLYERGIEMASLALHDAGFVPQELGAYVLAGLPGQAPEEVHETLEYARALGLPPYLAEYSPIPHTRLWTEAKRMSPYPIGEEPLYHNNTLLPCWPEAYRSRHRDLKEHAMEIRRSLAAKAC
jgi:radical SAM superfamily enzyme YgiQ (UPF0313 family)